MIDENMPSFPRIVLGILILSFPLTASVLVGTSVTGSFEDVGLNINFFDPANLGPDTSIPPGYLNASGPTVTIQNPAVEFGVAGDDQAGTTFLVTSDFTDTRLTMDLQVTVGANATVTALSVVFDFTDSAFSALQVSKLSDTFPSGISFSLAGGALNLTWPGERYPVSTQSQSFERTAVFDFTPSLTSVPEPGTLALMAAAMIGMAMARRLQKR